MPVVWSGCAYKKEKIMFCLKWPVLVDTNMPGAVPWLSYKHQSCHSNNGTRYPKLISKLLFFLSPQTRLEVVHEVSLKKLVVSHVEMLKRRLVHPLGLQIRQSDHKNVTDVVEMSIKCVAYDMFKCEHIRRLQ